MSSIKKVYLACHPVELAFLRKYFPRTDCRRVLDTWKFFCKITRLPWGSFLHLKNLPFEYNISHHHRALVCITNSIRKFLNSKNNGIVNFACFRIRHRLMGATLREIIIWLQRIQYENQYSSSISTVWQICDTIFLSFPFRNDPFLCVHRACRSLLLLLLH